MFCVGLTGGIASGKSNVARLFSELGVPMIDTDQLSRSVTEKNSSALKKIERHFGVEILNANETLNRKKLREVIFNDPKERLWLNALLHPLIRAKVREAVAAVTAPYCICVIPLLVEAKHHYEFLDRICVVDIDPAIQIQRLIERDQINVELAEKIRSAQSSREARLAIADDIIENNSDLHALKSAVLELHQKYNLASVLY